MTALIEDEIRELEAVAQLREDFYRLLSTLYFSPPREELLSELLSQRFADSLEEIFGCDIAVFFHRWRGSATSGRHELEQEFSDLFCVPGRRYVHPYESAFREKRFLDGKEVSGLLMGRTTRQVLARYAEADALPTGIELPDHIAVEFGFMQLLVSKERAAWQTGSNLEALSWLQKEREFLSDHLATWIGDLSATVLKSSQNDFYRGLASLAREFVLLDVAVLAELPDSP